jgi:hypothetical protein
MQRLIEEICMQDERSRFAQGGDSQRTIPRK